MSLLFEPNFCPLRHNLHGASLFLHYYTSIIYLLQKSQSKVKTWSRQPEHNACNYKHMSVAVPRHSLFRLFFFCIHTKMRLKSLRQFRQFLMDFARCCCRGRCCCCSCWRFYATFLQFRARTWLISFWGTRARVQWWRLRNAWMPLCVLTTDLSSMWHYRDRMQARTLERYIRNRLV